MHAKVTTKTKKEKKGRFLSGRGWLWALVLHSVIWAAFQKRKKKQIWIVYGP